MPKAVCDQCKGATPPPGMRCPKCRNSTPYPKHRCAALGCDTMIDESMLMCFPHWRRVPKEVQRAIWATVGARQEPYWNARQAAIEAVARKEGKTIVKGPSADERADADRREYEESRSKS